MAKSSRIAWTDNSFHPWWGCRRVSPACDRCYAAAFSKRVGSVGWDRGAVRTFGEKHWSEPLTWARKACASMADVFDAEALSHEREKLWATIRETTNLDWQLLTKRPNQALKLLPGDLQDRPDVWIGCTAETMKMFQQRLRLLRKLRTPVRFLSIEPMLEAMPIQPADLEGISWVILGGETGHGARPMHPDWVRGIRDVGAAAGVPFLFKQWGDHDASGKRVGRKKAGHLLDGEEYRRFPLMEPFWDLDRQVKQTKASLPEAKG